MPSFIEYRLRYKIEEKHLLPDQVRRFKQAEGIFFSLFFFFFGLLYIPSDFPLIKRDGGGEKKNKKETKRPEKAHADYSSFLRTKRSSSNSGDTPNRC